MSEFVTESTNDVPQRAIMMWSGDPESVPAGWTLCDGTSPDDVDITVPDLRNQFTVGAGDSYDVGDTGGVAEATLDEQHLPEHDHDSGRLSVPSHSHGNGSLSASNHSHGNGSLSASNHSHDSGSLSASNHDHGSGSLSTTTDGRHRHAYARGTGSSTNVYNNPDYSAISEFGGTRGDETSPNGDHSHGISGKTGSASPGVSGNTGSSGANVTGSTGGSGANVTGQTGSASPSISGATGTTGDSDPHENRPPFYALAYIMKI